MLNSRGKWAGLVVRGGKWFSRCAVRNTHRGQTFYTTAATDFRRGGLANDTTADSGNDHSVPCALIVDLLL